MEENILKLTKYVSVLLKITNIGIIEEEDGLYVIDSGPFEKDGNELAQTLASLFPEKKILALINTHSHSDHAGGNAAFIKKTQAPLWAPEKDAVFLESPGFITMFYWAGLPFAELEDDRFRSLASVKPERLISQGKIAEGKNVIIEAVSLEGHFLSHMGFLVTDKVSEQTVLFCGDALFGRELLNRTWIPFLTDPEEFRTSLLVIENTQADIYVPSHGNPVKKDGIDAACEINTLVTLEDEALILKLLSEPLSTETLIKKALDYAGADAKIAQYIWIGVTLRSYLSSLEKRNLIEHFMKDNILYWRKK